MVIFAIHRLHRLKYCMNKKIKLCSNTMRDNSNYDYDLIKFRFIRAINMNDNRWIYSIHTISLYIGNDCLIYLVGYKLNICLFVFCHGN